MMHPEQTPSKVTGIHGVKVAAVSRGRREIVLDDGTIVPFAALHASDGEDVEEILETGFATAELPTGGWIGVKFQDYPVTDAS